VPLEDIRFFLQGMDSCASPRRSAFGAHPVTTRDSICTHFLDVFAKDLLIDPLAVSGCETLFSARPQKRERDSDNMERIRDHFLKVGVKAFCVNHAQKTQGHARVYASSVYETLGGPQTQHSREALLRVSPENAGFMADTIAWMLRVFPHTKVPPDIMYDAVWILKNYMGNMQKASLILQLSPYKTERMSTVLVEDMRKMQHCCLIAATCVGVALKWGKNCTPFVYSDLRNTTCEIFHYTVQDFIVVELDVLVQCDWMPCAVRTPFYFLSTLFALCTIEHEKVIIDATDRLDRCVCHKALLTHGSLQLAIVCIVTALQKWNLANVYLSKMSTIVAMPVDAILADTAAVRVILGECMWSTTKPFYKRLLHT